MPGFLAGDFIVPGLQRMILKLQVAFDDVTMLVAGMLVGWIVRSRTDLDHGDPASRHAVIGKDALQNAGKWGSLPLRFRCTVDPDFRLALCGLPQDSVPQAGSSSNLWSSRGEREFQHSGAAYFRAANRA